MACLFSTLTLGALISSERTMAKSRSHRAINDRGTLASARYRNSRCIPARTSQHGDARSAMTRLTSAVCAAGAINSATSTIPLANRTAMFKYLSIGATEKHELNERECECEKCERKDCISEKGWPRRTVEGGMDGWGTHN